MVEPARGPKPVAVIQNAGVRIALCTGGSGSPWHLPASVLDGRAWIAGGERSLYELAFAFASLGHDVELRGNISSPVFRELAAVTDHHPAVGLPSRRPGQGDVVVLLEGSRDPLEFAAAAFSPARAILLVLAPLGLFGWSFEPGWRPPDPLTVDPSEVGTARQFAAASAFGFELWTNSQATADIVAAAGLECRHIGVGSPLAAPDRVPRRHDVVIVGGNRWGPLARTVVDGIDGSWVATTPGPTTHILRQLGAARLLVHPVRIEGHSRLGIEARIMGTVPLMLASNRFGAGMTRDEGAVVVPTVESMRGAVADLLADRRELEQLSVAATAFAASFVDWDKYRDRVAAALGDEPEGTPGAAARSAVGDRIDEFFRAYGELEAHARGLERDRERLRRRIEDEPLPQVRAWRMPALLRRRFRPRWR